jgi:(p)ppGpp synthase/HD superfamily hydrolase
LNQARAFAIAAHEACKQRRKYSGEPYWYHPRRVAFAVEDHGMSQECIDAAWLHDVVEDTPITLYTIALVFGPVVAQLVKELTKVSRPEDGNRATRKAIDRAYLAGVSAEAQTIKCFDIIDNMEDIWENDPDFAVQYAREKLEVLKVMNLADDAPRTVAFQVCLR